jgi:serine/threonine protein kinase
MCDPCQFPITAIREMKLLSSMRHPNIVWLKDIVSYSGKRYKIYQIYLNMGEDGWLYRETQSQTARLHQSLRL